ALLLLGLAEERIPVAQLVRQIGLVLGRPLDGIGIAKVGREIDVVAACDRDALLSHPRHERILTAVPWRDDRRHHAGWQSGRELDHLAHGHTAISTLIRCMCVINPSAWQARGERKQTPALPLGRQMGHPPPNEGTARQARRRWRSQATRKPKFREFAWLLKSPVRSWSVTCCGSNRLY